MIREVLSYPNKTLKQKSKDVEVFDETLHTLLEDMNETMMSRGGVGLAAIQIGVALRVLVINIPDENDEQKPENLIEAINPVITEREDEIVFKEGCLSVPEFYEEIIRSKRIKVEYFNRFGEPKEIFCEDFMAVAWQHEIDHLNGRLFIEKLSILKRKKFEKEYSSKKDNKTKK